MFNSLSNLRLKDEIAQELYSQPAPELAGTVSTPNTGNPSFLNDTCETDVELLTGEGSDS